MQTTKCIECGTETFQKDSICALCEAGITQMREDLMLLLNREKRWNPPPENKNCEKK